MQHFGKDTTENWSLMRSIVVAVQGHIHHAEGVFYFFVILNLSYRNDARAHFGANVKPYQIELSHSVNVASREIYGWLLSTKKINFCNLQSTISIALQHTNTETYLNVRTLLRTFLSIPCTTPSAERTFSDLTRLKMCL